MADYLLEILEKEKQGILLERQYGNLLMEETSREHPNEAKRNLFIMKRDEGLRMVNEARYELKSYLSYFGIGRR